MPKARGKKVGGVQQKKFEDLNDPERRPAMDFGHESPVKEGDKVVGSCNSWFLEDKQQAVNIVEWENGEISCYIENFDEEFPTE